MKKRKLLVLLIILISSSAFAKIGETQNFWLISQQDYTKRISKGQDVQLRRYIVVPYVDKNYKNILATYDEQAILAKFSFMLHKNKVNEINKYFISCNNALEINNFLKGLYYFSKKQFEEAITHLESSEIKAYRFLQLLIIADCKYELLADKRSYKKVIDAYQIASDNTDSEQQKTIINNRIRYIKYQ